MDLDAVETGGKGVSRCMTVLLDDLWNFGSCERAGCYTSLKASLSKGLSIRTNRRRSHRQATPRLERGVRHPPDMPELRKDPTAAGMDGLNHLSPSRDLCVIVDARRKGIASPLGRDVGPLSDE